MFSISLHPLIVDIVSGPISRPIPTQWEKFAKAGYVSICDGEEVNTCDGFTVKIVMTKVIVLRGW